MDQATPGDTTNQLMRTPVLVLSPIEFPNMPCVFSVTSFPILYYLICSSPTYVRLILFKALPANQEKSDQKGKEGSCWLIDSLGGNNQDFLSYQIVPQDFGINYIFSIC